MIHPGNGGPGGQDAPMKISGNFIHFPPPLQNAKFQLSLACSPSPPGGLHLSTPKWAPLTLTLCTQHCVPVSQLHVPHQNSASTYFSKAYEVMSMLDAITYGLLYVLGTFCGKTRTRWTCWEGLVLPNIEWHFCDLSTPYVSPQHRNSSDFCPLHERDSRNLSLPEPGAATTDGAISC